MAKRIQSCLHRLINAFLPGSLNPSLIAQSLVVVKDKWPVTAMQQPGSNMALAVVADQPTDQYNLSDFDSSDSEDENDFLPPGPLEPEKCTLSGPGFVGGSAGSPVSFVITAKDARSKRVRDGGDYVTVQVRPMRGVVSDQVQPNIKDQGDGSYTVTYSVSARGNYEVHCSFAHLVLLDTYAEGSCFPLCVSSMHANCIHIIQTGAKTFHCCALS